MPVARGSSAQRTPGRTVPPRRPANNAAPKHPAGMSGILRRVNQQHGFARHTPVTQLPPPPRRSHATTAPRRYVVQRPIGDQRRQQRQVRREPFLRLRRESKRSSAPARSAKSRNSAKLNRRGLAGRIAVNHDGSPASTSWIAFVPATHRPPIPGSARSGPVQSSMPMDHVRRAKFPQSCGTFWRSHHCGHPRSGAVPRVAPPAFPRHRRRR